MENLSTLEKIYQYGETLSSEEMNQIVSYVNNTIDAVNALIRNNNGINSGHCELRYKNSSSQPQKPTTGSNGLTNGWSNTYSLPNTSQGETAWMTICFVTGENVYGEWSTPVCISWGSVTGQQGPPGQAGTKGAFTSRVFKRANSKPDTPIGGTYDDPVPSGWYDGVPDGVAIIWSSTCTFYGNGTQTAWSEPAQESDTATLDIEFSPSTIQPNAPLGNIPYSNHEIEGWYDPNSPNFDNVGPMIWRAERKVSNGEYDGNWTITRIFGEKGDQGLTGEAGGHYEFRYKNYKPTQEVPVPTKPDTGTEGRSNGWSDTQTTLSEMQLKEGVVTWMTQCFFDEHGYGTWTTPIRITGANGVDGADGTDYEFIYTRNNTGITPATPARTQKSEASLFGNLGYWIDPDSGVRWTDDPQGVDDELMWEFVSTRTKQAGLWSAWTDPVVWAKWGKQGKIGPMSYLAGTWASNVTYTKTAEKNPVVYHNNNYYYLKGEITLNNPTITSLGQNPTGTYTDENPNPWAQAENFEMVFTDILFVNEFAKLESFIISGDWMFSQSGTLYYRNTTNSNVASSSVEVYKNHPGTLNGVQYTVNTAYLQFDPQYPNQGTPPGTGTTVNGVKHPNPNFVPDFAIDSLSGRCFFWKGKFTGDIHANNGYFRGEVHATSGEFTGTITAGGGSKIGKFTVDSNGNISGNNATFTGNIVANSLTLGTGVTISESDVDGLEGHLNGKPNWNELADVASSGSYNDLTNKPTIPASISDLTNGANILYTSDVSISEQTTSNGLTKRTITVGDKTFTEIEGGDFILTNVGLGTDSDSNDYVKISNNGVLKARNAIIYGTIYASAGNIGGFSIDSNGNISGNDATFSGIVNATGGTFSGDITIGGTLIIQKSGSSDGLKLDSSGNIKRYDGSDWVDLFAVRHTKYVSTSTYSCTNSDDLVLAGYNGATITLPANPPNGKCITVRNIGTDHSCRISGGTHNVNIGGADTPHGTNWADLNNDDRAEFIYYGGTWYWNAYGT